MEGARTVVDARSSKLDDHPERVCGDGCWGGVERQQECENHILCAMNDIILIANGV